jgi:hypothetical protein
VGTASPVGDALSSKEDVGASSKSWMCDTTLKTLNKHAISVTDVSYSKCIFSAVASKFEVQSKYSSIDSTT